MRLFLFLDYDGTLVPIADTPEQAVAPPELRQLLRRLTARKDLRVAVVSGRDLPDLQALLPVPGLYLGACHGALIQEPGAAPYTLAEDADRTRLNRLARAAETLIAGRRGFLVELKTCSLAFHYRLADPAEAETIRRSFAALRKQYCPEPAWELIPGRKVLEVRPAGINKGTAVRHLLSRWPDACPVYAGDDITDEDAFRALADNGWTILIADTPRLTAAKQSMPRTAFLDFLQRLAAEGAAALSGGLPVKAWTVPTARPSR